MSKRSKTTLKLMMIKLMMMNKSLKPKQDIYVRLWNISAIWILSRSFGRPLSRQIIQHPLGEKQNPTKLTWIFIGFTTFFVIAPGDLSRMASKVHHLIKGSFLRSSSDTSILSLPVVAWERSLCVKIRFHTCFDTCGMPCFRPSDIIPQDFKTLFTPRNFLYISK